MDVSIAYQGGGAKLFDLLAAVKAAKQLNGPDFNVIRVSGASAGAIAAVIHALDGDIDKIISNSDKLKLVIKRCFPRKRLNLVRALPRIFLGKPLFDAHATHDAISALLKLAGIEGSLPINVLTQGKAIQLRILCSDILGLSRPVHSENSPTQLIDALVDSSAIPFAFRMPIEGNSKHSILDGGIFQNLPSQEALKDLAPGQRALGLSFKEPKRSIGVQSAFAYAGSIVGSMISERVKDSAQQLGPANVIELDTDIGTFDFERLFASDIPARFETSRSQAHGQISSWIDGSIARHSPDWFSLSASDLLELEQLTSAHARDFLEKLGPQNYHADEARHDIFAKSLLGQEHSDRYTLTLKLSGDRNQGLQFLRFRFYAPDGQQLLQPELKILDGSGQSRLAFMIPVRETGLRARSVLVCLAKPLAAGETLTIIKIETAHGAMKRYQSEGWTEETFAMGPGKSADRMIVTMRFPRERKPKIWTDARSENDRERKELEAETGVQLLTERIETIDTEHGFCICTSSTDGAKSVSHETRFIKLFYYR